MKNLFIATMLFFSSQLQAAETYKCASEATRDGIIKKIQVSFTRLPNDKNELEQLIVWNENKETGEVTNFEDYSPLGDQPIYRLEYKVVHSFSGLIEDEEDEQFYRKEFFLDLIEEGDAILQGSFDYVYYAYNGNDYFTGFSIEVECEIAENPTDL